MENIQGFFFKDFKNSYIPNILHEIYYEKIYSKYLTGKSDLTIVDWGANIGLTSHYFKDFAKQVYAVEPSKSHLECINKMIEFNDIKNIKVCPYAISNTTGSTKFFHNINSTMFSLKDTVNDKSDFEEVETLTVDDFVKREGITHIDFLKWDTEGFESEIFTSEGFLKTVPIIDTVIGEFHDWTVMSADLFANTFKDLGFEFSWIHNAEAHVYIATKK